MTAEQMIELKKRQPFRPFRMRLTNGSTCDIHQADMLMVTRDCLVVAKLSRENPLDPIFESPSFVATAHVIAIESIPDHTKDQPIIYTD